MCDIARNTFTYWLSLSILKTSPPSIKLKYREVEKIAIKLAKTESHLLFNETCLNNRLLPTYTKVSVHYKYSRERKGLIENLHL